MNESTKTLTKVLKSSDSENKALELAIENISNDFQPGVLKGPSLEQTSTSMRKSINFFKTEERSMAMYFGIKHLFEY